MSRAFMLLWGFPEPQLQCEYHDALGFVARTDFTWAALNHVIDAEARSARERIGQFDGWGKYFGGRGVSGAETIEVIKREKRRENRLLALGHPVLRWDWQDLERPAQFRAKLLSFGLEPTRSAAIDRKCA
ncbi:hypothetical protein [Sinomonas notoginsengisoli]|uniref:hypothetical protein n=1 Tax=Sinomonas notoginsengisoli TaxID=1457311 RepID=UPI001F174500|nr:hypothetical protein [Sinomonas notoginsengisoli]